MYHGANRNELVCVIDRCIEHDSTIPQKSKQTCLQSPTQRDIRVEDNVDDGRTVGLVEKLQLEQAN